MDKSNKCRSVLELYSARKRNKKLSFVNDDFNTIKVIEKF